MNFNRPARDPVPRSAPLSTRFRKYGCVYFLQDDRIASTTMMPALRTRGREYVTATTNQGTWLSDYLSTKWDTSDIRSSATGRCA